MAVLLSLAAVSLFFIASSLFAEQPDTTKPALRKGTFVMRDTTTHPPSPVSAKALERLNANSTEKWNVQWHRTTGLPGIGGGVTKRKYEGNPEEIALAFVDDYKDLFLGIDDPEKLLEYWFDVRNSRSFGKFIMVGLQAYYRGVKINQGWLSVEITNSGQPKSVENSLWQVCLQDVTPSLTQADVEELIQKAAAPKDVVKSSEQRKTLPWSEVPIPEGANPDTMNLYILPSLPPRLVYIFVRFIDGDPHRYIVDAHTGEMLSAAFMGIVDRFRGGSSATEQGQSERDTGGINPRGQESFPDRIQIMAGSVAPCRRHGTLGTFPTKTLL